MASSSSTPPILESDVGAYEKDRLEELSQNPNTTVYTVDHDQKHTVWKPKRLKKVIEGISTKVQELGKLPEMDDFKIRKECMKDEEILAFQREHPKTYWMLTDRSLSDNPKAHAAIVAILHVHSRLSAGEIDEKEADAAATNAVIRAMQ